MTDCPGKNRPIHVLLVDDCAEDRETYRRFLSSDKNRSYVIRHAESLEETWALISSRSPDCLLLDYQLPDGDGLELLQKLSEPTGHPVFPVIILTGQGDEEVAVQAMKLGATDYLIKSHLSPEIISRAIQNATEKADLLQTIRKQQEEKDHLIQELREALEQVNTLRGILPICSFCKKIRNDKNYWEQVESYISSHSQLFFSHSVCPDCIKANYPELEGEE